MSVRSLPGLLIVSLAVSLAPARPSPAAPADTEAGSSVRPVATVDLTRYTGLWYEIAKIPNRFQKECVRETTAEYRLRADGQLTVINRCLKRDGSYDEARGVARVVDPVTKARLEVSFVSFLGWRPFWGDYWVLGLDSAYQWAIVGTPDRKYGWILARSKNLPEPTLAQIFALLTENGYDQRRFVMNAP